jgi:enoyl-CoA hydratase/carnithine racemase
MSESITIERRGSIALLTLERPDRRNALNLAMLEALAARVAELEASLPRAVVVTGAGVAFCAGADVRPDNPLVEPMREAIAKGDPAVARRMLAQQREAVDRLVRLPVPVLVALNGVAYGGGAELAVRCDLRVMDPAAELCFSEVKLGLMPDFGGGVALTRLIGPGRAADLILTARRLGAAEALALGVVNRVSAPGACVAEALQLAESIARNGPRAVRRALAVIRRTPDLNEEEALALEQEEAAALIASGECIAGITAFLTRTEPQFPTP